MKLPRTLDGGLRAGIATVAVAGISVSAYLTAVRAAGGTPACAITGGCAEVQESAYSDVAGIPVAALGLVAYATLLVAAFLPGELGRLGGLFVALVGAGFSGWLTSVEFGVIGAICSWCVVSAGLMAVALILAVARLCAPDHPLPSPMAR